METKLEWLRFTHKKLTMPLGNIGWFLAKLPDCAGIYSNPRARSFESMSNELKSFNICALKKLEKMLDLEWWCKNGVVVESASSTEFKNFSTSISHELSQPLTFIKIILESILLDINNGCLDSVELSHDCEEALEQIRRITIYINQLRNLEQTEKIEE